jgi:hypothetical protein
MSRGHSDCGRMIQILDSVWAENSSALADVQLRGFRGEFDGEECRLRDSDHLGLGIFLQRGERKAEGGVHQKESGLTHDKCRLTQVRRARTIPEKCPGLASAPLPQIKLPAAEAAIERIKAEEPPEVVEQAAAG